jgi:hypothetical protein
MDTYFDIHFCDFCINSEFFYYLVNLTKNVIRFRLMLLRARRGSIYFFYRILNFLRKIFFNYV